jgi:hypothetical protein
MNGFATSMDPDQRSLIRIHAVSLPTLLQEEKLIANSMDPDQTAQMRRLVCIHAGRKHTMLALSWHGSNHEMKNKTSLTDISIFKTFKNLFFFIKFILN